MKGFFKMISLVPTSVKKNWNILFNGIEIYKLNLNKCKRTFLIKKQNKIR
jgi:hypothetical protein